jgi:hypothetical protein
MDPVEGGSADDYDYVSADPINATDLNDGTRRPSARSCGPKSLPTASTVLHRLADYTAEHATLYRNVYPSAASQQTADAYREVIRPVCRRLAADLGRGAGTAATEVVADFLIGGIIEVSRLGTEDPVTGGAPRAEDLRARIDACLAAVGIRLG